MDIVDDLDNVDTTIEDCLSILLEIQNYLDEFEKQEYLLPSENAKNLDALEMLVNSNPIWDCDLSGSAMETKFSFKNGQGISPAECDQDQQLHSPISTPLPETKSTPTGPKAVSYVPTHTSGTGCCLCPLLLNSFTKEIFRGPPGMIWIGYTEVTETCPKTTMPVSVNYDEPNTTMDYDTVELDDFMLKARQQKVVDKLKFQSPTLPSQRSTAKEMPSEASSESPQSNRTDSTSSRTTQHDEPALYKKNTPKSKTRKLQVSTGTNAPKPHHDFEPLSSPRVSSRQRKAPTRYGEWIPMSSLRSARKRSSCEGTKPAIQ